ncbi:MAG TPA: hypothetical protein VNH11_20465 [Pirellulales bacterium]|nr:hypothetical protein [Pirellulales bacterium]
MTPNKNDVTGLSMGRAAFCGPEEEAAKGRSGKRYYVAVLLAAKVKAGGAAVVPRPLPDDVGHAEIVNLTYRSKKTEESLKLIQSLRSAVLRVEGPFDGRAVPG